MSTNAELHQRRMAAVPRGVANSLAVYADRASNAELWDVEGNRYIDFASGIAVLNTGHRHPSIVKAIGAQLEKLIHTCFQVTPYASYIELCEQLNKLAPGSTPALFVPLHTGGRQFMASVISFRRDRRRVHAPLPLVACAPYRAGSSRDRFLLFE